MEMHQIRYFLGVSRTLNFTRAAEECNVSQPSLTRAIKLLEDELGGELFRRERNHSHLTDLGSRMLPLMQQCYDTAQGVRSLATAMKKGEIATLRLALSRTIDIGLLIPFLSELLRAMNSLELKFLRGTADEIAEIMKQGDADLAISGPIGASWERFDARPLFNDRFALFVNTKHRLANRTTVDIADLPQERLLSRTYCEMAEPLAAQLRSLGLSAPHGHEVSSEQDLIALLEGNMGVAIAPRTTSITQNLKRLPVDRLELERVVYLYAVAGRPRSASAATLMKQLQAADWSQVLN
jgi:DNA-binding transcriptional LysR family regulator